MDHLHVLEISEVIQLRNCPLCMKSKTRDWQNHLIQSIVWKCAVRYLRHVKGADMDVMGSHRQYDQGFMKNLERLQQTDSSQHSTSQLNHSPRKQSCPDSKIFPPDCIFCGVVNKTLPAFGCSSHKTERWEFTRSQDREFTNQYRKHIRTKERAGGRTSQIRPISVPLTMKPSTQLFSLSKPLSSFGPERPLRLPRPLRPFKTAQNP